MSRIQAIGLYLTLPAAMTASIEAFVEPIRRNHSWVGGSMIALGLLIYLICARTRIGSKLETAATIVAALAMCTAITGAMLFVAPVIRAKIFQPTAQPTSDGASQTSPANVADYEGSSISVIVDHGGQQDAASQSMTRQVLSSIDQAIFDSSGSLPQPVLLRYDAINQGSTDFRPGCVGQYRANVITGNSATAMGTTGRLRQFLSMCSSGVIADTRDGQPNIPAALVAAEQSSELAGPRFKRVIIVISNFPGTQNLDGALAGVRLSGVRVVLLYRMTPQDAANVGAFRSRLYDWTFAINRSGANAVAYDQNAVLVSSSLSRVLQAP